MALSVDRIFPTENDVGGSQKGRVITETNLSNVLFGGGNPVLQGSITELQSGHVIKGCKPTISSGLIVDIEAGELYIAGFRVVLNASTITVNASETDAHWYVTLSTSGGLVTGVTTTRIVSPTFGGNADVVHNLSGQSSDPDVSVKLFACNTDSTSITSLTGYRRRLRGSIHTGQYEGDNVGSQDIDLDFRPRIVLVHAEALSVFGVGWDYYTSSTTPVGLSWTNAGGVTGSSADDERPLILENGFRVDGIGPEDLNRGSERYFYHAWG